MGKALKNTRRPWEIPAKNYNKMQGQGRKGGKGAQKFYKSAPWRRVRALQLQEHPLCQCPDCQGKDPRFPADTVDHIKPINRENPYDTERGKYGEPLDPKNLKSYYKNHHNRKSAYERNGKKWS